MCACALVSASGLSVCVDTGLKHISETEWK